MVQKGFGKNKYIEGGLKNLKVPIEIVSIRINVQTNQLYRINVSLRK
jgi:hypothetical protein